VVVTLICPGFLSAQKKGHGALITVIKKDGQFVQGELLKVNNNEILLLSCSQSGNTIPVSEIKMIELEKKGRFISGAAIGIGISMIAGGITGASMRESEGGGSLAGVIYGAVSGIPLGILTGLIASHSVKHKSFNFENASQREVFMNLLKLKALARF
jgi:uncharacterized membrane protein YedE/YeeE